MTEQILFGTHNPSKIKRFQDACKFPEGYKLVTPQELNLPKFEIEENGQDEWENAKIKAIAYFEKSIVPALSLDTGFYIEGLKLEEQPGKHVQRKAGVLETDSGEVRFEKMTKFYIDIANKFGGEVEAYFKDVFCLFDGESFLRQEALRPVLLTNKIVEKDVHFPIASLYKVEKFNKYHHQLSALENDEYVRPSVEAVERIVAEFVGKTRI